MAASQDTPRLDPARRAVVTAVGAAGLAAAVAACGGSGDSGSEEGSTGGADTGTPTGDATDATDATTNGATEETGGDTGGGSGGTPLARTTDIPEGGGKVFKKERVVVTQPTAGDFKAFSATCTHQGCVVGDVSDGTINCPCHGSKFAIADGSVKNGPASRPLPSEKIEVSGGEITLP